MNAVDGLAAEDEACAAFSGWGSLEPDRERAHLPSELVQAHPTRTELPPALALIGQAIRQSYPENLFADLDALTASLAAREGDALTQAAQRIADLHRLYGRATSIRFRYVHDFVYGFDWARWVAREPITRASVGPFDDRFLDYLELRGRELLALIAENDAKYPVLADRVARSPFPFSREPDAERVIHRSLARKGLIPVAAWSATAHPVWDRPFVELREAEARELGLWLG